MENGSEKEGWPPSNYPIFLALVLLTATAVTLAVGDEKRAEDLAIYAYYFLVIGVTIRFFELALPENTVQRVGLVLVRISDWLKTRAKHTVSVSQKLARLLRIPHVRLPYIRLPSFDLPWVRKLHVSIGILEKNLALISDVSRNVAVFLSVFFVISIIYGLMIDWWAVKGYIPDLILAIFGFLTLHLLTHAVKK